MSSKTLQRLEWEIPPKSHFYDYKHEMGKYVYIDRERGVVIPENMLEKLDKKNLLNLTKHKAVEEIAKNIYIAVFRKGENGWYLDRLINNEGKPVEDRELKEMVEKKLSLWRKAEKKHEYKYEESIHHALANMMIWLSKAGLVKSKIDAVISALNNAEGREERAELSLELNDLNKEMEKLVSNASKISQGYLHFIRPLLREGRIGEIELPNGIVRILLKNTYNYTVLNIYSPYEHIAQEIQERLLKSIINAKRGKYGYSVLVPKVKNYVELYDLVKTIYDKAIEPLKEELRKIIIENKTKEAEEIKKARQELGIHVPPEEEITGKDIEQLILQPEAEETGEEEIPEIEEILEEIEGTVPVSTAVGSRKEEEKKEKSETESEEEIEKETEEKLRKIREITAEDIARLMARHGFMRVRMFVFDLPTEYLGAKTKYEKVGKKYVESKIFEVNPAKYRTLRKKFYTLLHKIAFRTPSGWIMYEKPSQTVLREIDKVINELNKLSGRRRAVYMMELYLPRDYIAEWITNNIQEVKANIEEIKQRLMNEELKKREVKRLEKRLNELIEELKNLEKQLKYIQA